MRRRTWIVLAALAALAIINACGCALIPGIPGIPPEPTQALIDAAKKDLSADDANGLQILFKYYHEILTDGVHNGDT